MRRGPGIALRGLAFLAIALPATHTDARTTIVLDAVHAHTYADSDWRAGDGGYHVLHGSASWVAEVRARGAEVRVHREGRLDAVALGDADALVIDLVSDDLPAFAVAEIEAIVDFVRGGGGLLVVTDHSNAYHHANKLEPLLDLLDLRVHRESALDATHAVGDGPGWIVVDRFDDHPITRSVARIALQTGGPTDERFGVAWTSPDAWADLWATAPYGENDGTRNERGNYGDFVRSADERSGPLAVVSAREFGAGRIVVVGDQNLFGNVWIRYADNLVLARRALGWVSGDDTLAGGDAFPVGEGPRVQLLEDAADPRFGDDGPDGHYQAFVELALRARVLARSYVVPGADRIVIAPSRAPLEDTQREMLQAFVHGGGELLWLVPGDAPGEATTSDLDAVRREAPGRVRVGVEADAFDNRALRGTDRAARIEAWLEAALSPW